MNVETQRGWDADRHRALLARYRQSDVARPKLPFLWSWKRRCVGPIVNTGLPSVIWATDSDCFRFAEHNFRWQTWPLQHVCSPVCPLLYRYLQDRKSTRLNSSHVAT